MIKPTYRLPAKSPHQPHQVITYQESHSYIAAICAVGSKYKPTMPTTDNASLTAPLDIGRKSRVRPTGPMAMLLK